MHSGIIAFFITCAFAAPVDEEKGTLNQYINRLPTGLALLLLFLSLHRISMHVTKTAMVVDAGFVIFFIVAIVKREVNPSKSLQTLKSLNLNKILVGMELDRFQNWC